MLEFDRTKFFLIYGNDFVEQFKLVCPQVHLSLLKLVFTELIHC